MSRLVGREKLQFLAGATISTVVPVPASATYALIACPTRTSATVGYQGSVDGGTTLLSLECETGGSGGAGVNLVESTGTTGYLRQINVAGLTHLRMTMSVGQTLDVTVMFIGV